MLPYLRVIW